jgi:hypothetical protein
MDRINTNQKTTYREQVNTTLPTEDSIARFSQLMPAENETSDVPPPQLKSETEISIPSVYNTNHKYYHYYQLNNYICNTKQPYCTSDNVFQELKRYPAPGWDGSKSVTHGEISTIGPLAIGGKVVHVVDTKNQQITNITLPGHIFENGEVRRKVVEDNGKIKINTVGEGINTSAEKYWLNMNTYREGVEGFVDGFADLDRSIKANFEEKYSK